MKLHPAGLKFRESKLGRFNLALIALIAATVAVSFFNSPAQAAEAEASVPAGDLRVNFLGCPNSKGTVKCAIYKSADGFPMDRSKITMGAAAPVINRQAVCEFKGIKPGTYAVAAFQDEDGTGDIRKNMLGIPTEVYGFSNDARNAFSAPSFNQAAFNYPGGAYEITIHAK